MNPMTNTPNIAASTPTKYQYCFPSNPANILTDIKNHVTNNITRSNTNSNIVYVNSSESSGK